MSDDSNAHPDGAGPGADHGVGHLVPLRALVATGLGLLVLTWITVVVSRVDLGAMNIYVALAVAVVKGSLVALFFMHLRWDRPFNGIVFVSSLVLVGLFMALTMVDTVEYQPDVEQGDAKDVVQILGQP